MRSLLFVLLACLSSACGPAVVSPPATAPVCDLIRTESNADVYICYSPNCALQVPNSRASLLYMQAVANPSTSTPQGTILKQCCDNGSGTCQ